MVFLKTLFAPAKFLVCLGPRLVEIFYSRAKKELIYFRESKKGAKLRITLLLNSEVIKVEIHPIPDVFPACWITGDPD